VHGPVARGCQAQCFLFWKEAWLKRVKEGDANSRPSPSIIEPVPHLPLHRGANRARLNELTLRPDAPNGSEIFYDVKLRIS